MKRATPPLALVLIALASVVAACGDDDAATPDAPGVVVIKDNSFKPDEITIAAGETVTWKFEGNNAHNVTFDDVHSDLMKDGEYERTFDEAGSFGYTCTLHPGMDGTVTVTDS